MSGPSWKQQKHAAWQCATFTFSSTAAFHWVGHCQTIWNIGISTSHNLHRAFWANQHIITVTERSYI